MSGGRSKKAPGSTLAETRLAGAVKKEIYPLYGQGMAGGGLLPQNLQKLRKEQYFGGLMDAWKAGKEEMMDWADLYDRDFAVKRALMSAADRQKQLAIDEGLRMFEQENINDRDLARQMATSAWGNELRMSIDAMQSFNQAESERVRQMANYGTFASGLMQGIGSFLPSYYFARRMGKQGSNNQEP